MVTVAIHGRTMKQRTTREHSTPHSHSTHHSSDFPSISCSAAHPGWLYYELDNITTFSILTVNERGLLSRRAEEQKSKRKRKRKRRRRREERESEGVGVAARMSTSAAVVSQPVVVASGRDIQAKVHTLLRNGLQPVTSDDAWVYVRELTPAQAHISKYAGYHRCHPVSCLPWLKCCLPCGPAGAYFMPLEFPIGGSCLCFPCCFLGICLPIYSCLCCTCERQDNAWITRDKNGYHNSDCRFVPFAYFSFFLEK